MSDQEGSHDCSQAFDDDSDTYADTGNSSNSYIKLSFGSSQDTNQTYKVMKVRLEASRNPLKQCM